jgi:hypothetical protein
MKQAYFHIDINGLTVSVSSDKVQSSLKTTHYSCRTPTCIPYQELSLQEHSNVNGNHLVLKFDTTSSATLTLPTWPSTYKLFSPSNYSLPLSTGISKMWLSYEAIAACINLSIFRLSGSVGLPSEQCVACDNHFPPQTD